MAKHVWTAPCLQGWWRFLGRAFACVHVCSLLVQPRLPAKMVSAGGRSKQSSDLERPLLRRFISRCGSNDPVHLSVSCKVGASAFKQCPRAPISSGGCDRPAGACVALAARHQLPGDPRHLVGERDRRELGRLTLQQRHEPAGRVVRGAPARLPDHRGRALPAVECSRGDAGPASSSPGARRSAGRRRGSPSSAGRRRSQTRPHDRGSCSRAGCAGATRRSRWPARIRAAC
jgi:hypothetical protein